MKRNIFDTTFLAVGAVWLLPSYMLGALSWRVRHGKWVWVNMLVYAELSKDWLSFFISWAIWVLLILLVWRTV
jgi:hypothetical protein